MNQNQPELKEASSLPVEHQLRAARERLSLTISELARRTCLSEAIIKSLEQDLSLIPHPTFLKAYLKAYIREVHLGEEIFLQCVSKMKAEEPTSNATLLQHQKTSRKNRFFFHFWTLFILVILFGLSIFNWKKHHTALSETQDFIPPLTNSKKAESMLSTIHHSDEYLTSKVSSMLEKH